MVLEKIGFSFSTRDNFSTAHFEFQSITKSPMINLKSSPENTYSDICIVLSVVQCSDSKNRFVKKKKKLNEGLWVTRSETSFYFKNTM